MSVPVRWIVAALLPAALVAAMIVVRLTVEHRFGWLLFNLGLAVLPVAIAAAVRPGRLWPIAPWLLFLPNAPYLVSDVAHFAPRAHVPTWFDAAMLGMLGAAGVFAGTVSVVWVTRCVRERLGAGAAVVAWLVVAAATGRAIELGRVQRHNSWDLLLHPLDVLRDAWTGLASSDVHVWGITAVYAAAVLVFGVALDLLVARPACQT